MAKNGLEVKLSIERVEAWLCGGGMEVGGGAKLEAGETMEQTGTVGGGGAAEGANEGRGAGGTGAKGWE